MTRLLSLVVIAFAAYVIGMTTSDSSQSRMPARDDLAIHAPDCNYIRRGPLLIGCPDRTGCARWVLERITLKDLQGPGDRDRSQWHVDPTALPERHAKPVDYLSAGWVRFHLAAARNHKRSQADTDATFSLANAVPGAKGFNQKAWLRIEDRAAELAKAGAVVWVLTLPIWQPEEGNRWKEKLARGATMSVGTIGTDDIWVPHYIGKSLLIERDGVMSCETYLAPNSDDVEDLQPQAFRVSVDELERIAGLNAWPGLPLEQQERLEAK